MSAEFNKETQQKESEEAPDLLEFRKEAIWRQMQEYKRLNAQTEEKALKAEASISEAQSELAKTRSFNQKLAASVSMLLQRLSGNELVGKVSFLKLDENNFEEFVLQWNSFVDKIVEPETKDVKSATDEAVRTLQVTIDLQQKQLLENISKVEELETVMKSLESENKQLSEQLNSLNQENIKLARQIDRNKFMKKSEVIAEDPVVENTKKTIVETSIQMKNLQALYEKRGEELDSLYKELSEIKREEIREPVFMPSRKDDSLREENSNLRETVERTMKDAEEFYHRKSEEISEMGRSFDFLTKQLENEKEHLLKDNNRLRSERDSLKQQIQEQGIKLDDVRKKAKNFETLFNTQKARCESMEVEIKRWKDLLEKEKEFKHSEDVQSIIEAFRQEENAIMDEMESVASAFDESQSAVEKSLAQLKEKEALIQKLLNDKSKLELIVIQKNRDQADLDQRWSDFRKAEQAKLTAFSKHAEVERELQTKLLEVEKELNIRKAASDMHKAKANSLSHKCSELASKNEAFHNQFKEAQEKVEKHRKEEVMLRSKVKRLSELTSNTDEKLEKELNRYKALFKCNSCHTREKDTCIIRCMHVFCRVCVDQRLETRQRKCPNCSEPFGSNDVRSIFI